MTFEIIIVLVIIGLAVFMFITERFSVDTVSIMVMLLLMITGILTPTEGFAGFSNPATITVGAMFVISASIFNTGALNGVGTLLTRIGKQNYTLCLLSIMLFAGLLSAFINDTAVVALFMPVVIQVAKDTNISPSKLLMPLSFGALMGGVCTLIGTSTNILVSGIAQRQGEEAISMFEMAPAGFLFLLAGIAYIVLIGNKLIPNRRAKDNLTESYDMGDYLTEVILLPNSRSVGKRISESNLVKELDIEIIEITRQNKLKVIAYPFSILQAHDILKVRCDVNKLKKLKDQVGIEIKSERKFSDADMKSASTKLFEAMVTPNSRLEGKSLKDVNFRAAYGASVLAIRHRNEILHEKLAHAKLKAGDVVLISGFIEEINAIKKSADVLILSETDESSFMYEKILPVLLIIFAFIFTAAIDLVPIVLGAATGCVLLVLIKGITVEQAYKAIDWKVIFMLAGVLAMGAALEKTGAASLLAGLIIDSVGIWGPQAVVSAFFFITFMSTSFMSNNATAALLAPIAIVAAASLGVSSKPFLMAVAYGASFSFMTPIGYQTNTMIYGPGNYLFKDYFKVGVPLNILFWIMASILIPIFFPF
ncbi:SLC13 family permease [soil metagenome]